MQRDGMIGLQECGPAPPRAPPAGNRARERTAQAVEYYNNHLQRARANAGLTAPRYLIFFITNISPVFKKVVSNRSSYNDRHNCVNNSSSRRQHLAPDFLYRSNSSLELLDHGARPCGTSSPTLKREYGSHGSIDVIDRPTPGTGESFFEMLQEYRPTVLGTMGVEQRSSGPSEYLRGKEKKHVNNLVN